VATLFLIAGKVGRKPAQNGFQSLISHKPAPVTCGFLKYVGFFLPMQAGAGIFVGVLLRGMAVAYRNNWM